MHISSHLEKIAHLESVRGRLDPIEDFELWFWATMVAGTNAVNAALHKAGITPAESAFPSQPGVYYAAAGDKHQPLLKELGDVLHVGRPAIKAAVSEDIQRMMHAMERIEAFRDPCTRGDMEPSADVVGQCRAAYDECMALMNKCLGAR